MDVFLILSGLVAFVLGTYGVIYFASVNLPNLPSISAEIEKPIPQISFWRRQFQSESTASQRKCDWAFGVILPVICFAFDPIVFKGEASFGGVKPFAYLLTFVAILAMMAWLIWGEKLKWFSGILAGLFAVSGMVSLAIGIVLFPISLVALIVLIGLLGFTPLFTSIIYLRNAKRAYQAAKPFLEKRVLIWSAVLSAMFGFAVPFTINAELNKRIEGLIAADVSTIKSETTMLKYFASIANFDVLAERYSELDENAERRLQIENAYHELTGKDLKEEANRIENLNN